MKYWHYSLVFFCFTALNCRNTVTRPIDFVSKNDLQELKTTTSTQEIHLDPKTPYDYIHIHPINSSDHPLILVTNLSNKSLDYYSLINGQLTKRINLNSGEIKSKIDNIGGVVYFSPDTLWLINNFHPAKSVLINSSGQIIDDHPFEDPAYSKELILRVAFCAGNCSPIRLGDRFYFKRNTFFDPLLKPDLLKTFNYLWSYSTKLKSFKPVKGSILPDEYAAYNMASNLVEPTYCLNEFAQLVISWPILNYLMIYDPENDTFSKPFQEYGVLNIQDDFSTGNNNSTILVNTFKNDQYNHILYDSVNHLYYRFLFHKLKEDELEQTSLLFNSYKQSFKILIYSKSYSILGYLSFPPNKYDAFRSFVFNGEIYLSNSNLNNPEFSEDKIVFTKIRLSGLH